MGLASAPSFFFSARQGGRQPVCKIWGLRVPRVTSECQLFYVAGRTHAGGEARRGGSGDDHLVRLWGSVPGPSHGQANMPAWHWAAEHVAENSIHPPPLRSHRRSWLTADRKFVRDSNQGLQMRNMSRNYPYPSSACCALIAWARRRERRTDVVLGATVRALEGRPGRALQTLEVHIGGDVQVLYGRWDSGQGAAGHKKQQEEHRCARLSTWIVPIDLPIRCATSRRPSATVHLTGDNDPSH